MTAIEFFNAILKNRGIIAKVCLDLDDIVDGSLDSLIDDYVSELSSISKTLYELYYIHAPEHSKITNLGQIPEAAWKAYKDIEKIETEAAKIADGDYVDTDELNQMAKEEDWDEEQKSRYFWDDVQIHWDDFIENLDYNYNKKVKDAYEEDDKLRWQYTSEVRHILRWIEKELGDVEPIVEDDVEDYINQNIQYRDEEIDFDKPIKPQVIMNQFEE